MQQPIEEVRLPPHSLSAEESVLGSIIVDPDCLPAVRKIINPQDFYRDRHGWIFQAMLDIADKGCGGDTEIRSVNEITVAHQLSVQDKLMACGGAAFLSHLAATLPTSVYAEDYARIVRDTADLRRQIEQGQKMTQDAYEGRRAERVPFDFRERLDGN